MHTLHLQMVWSSPQSATGIDCTAVCVVLQYMIGYQAVASLAGSITFFVNGSSFSHMQVTVYPPIMCHAML